MASNKKDIGSCYPTADGDYPANILKNMRIGSKVEVIGFFRERFPENHIRNYGSFFGEITKVEVWPGALTAENHGSITVRFPKADEHYSLYKWWEDLRVVDEEESV